MCIRDRLGAELGLVPGPAQEDHQVTGDQQRGLPSEVLLDQGQCQVDPGGDPGRGGDVPVPDVDRIGVHLDVRVPPGQRLAVRPVRGRPAPGQQPGLGEQEGPGAHRHHPLGPSRQLPDPRHQCAVRALGGRPAGDQQGVQRPDPGGPGPGRPGPGRPDLGEVQVRQQPQPAGAAHRPAALRGRDHPVRVRPPGGGARAREHLHGAGHVEALHALVEDDQHAACSHAASLSAGRGGSNDLCPTFPATPARARRAPGSGAPRRRVGE